MGAAESGQRKQREEYRRELEDTVQALRCHPCVGCWVPFNEGWGQYDAAGAVQAIRALDDTRLVDEASGWYDQAAGMYTPCTTTSTPCGCARRPAPWR